MKILIVDDHAIVRRGIQKIVSDEFKNAEFGEAADSTTALEMAWNEDWDVVILDVSLPGRNGLDVLKDIKRKKPSLPVLILSLHAADEFAVRSFKAGASGYLPKQTQPDELITAIKKVREGGKHVSHALAEKLAQSLEAGSEIHSPHELLSDREFEVLRMIASGKTVSEVAKELSLSVKTISTYRSRILEKMHMRTNAEITHYAIRMNLVD